MKSQSKKLKTTNKTLGEYLKEKRLGKNIKQISVSRKLGVCNQYISNFELNKCVVPQKYLKKLVKLYSINPDEIVTLILNEQRKSLERLLK